MNCNLVAPLAVSSKLEKSQQLGKKTAVPPGIPILLSFAFTYSGSDLLFSPPELLNLLEVIIISKKK